MFNANINTSQQTKAEIPGVLDLTVGNSPNSSSYSGIGSVGIGYSYLVNPSIVLSAELDANLQNSSTSNSTPINAVGSVVFNNTTTTTLRNSFAFLIKPGFLINQQRTLIYALIGPSLGNFSTSTNSSFLFTPIPGVVGNGTASNSSSGYTLGLTLGLGIQQYITNNLSLGLEYQYTNYGHISAPSSSGPIEIVPPGIPNGTLTNTISSIKAQTNSLMLNLTYHF